MRYLRSQPNNARAGAWSRRMPVVIALLAVSVIAGACSSASDEPGSASSRSNAPVSGDGPDGGGSRPAPIVAPSGASLAAVEGVGSVHPGTASNTDALSINVDLATAPELPKGALAVADGLAIEVGEPVAGLLELRLSLPPEPQPDAIPVALHRRDDGTLTLVPGLWDPATNEIVVGASEFSDWFGGWWNPANWIEEIVQVGQGAFDFAADYISGRTDPPHCPSDAPDWSRVDTSELSSVHVCLKANTAEDGTERAEIYLKSNRRTGQFISVPPGVEYLWVEDQPDWLRPYLTAAGMGSDGHILLLGGQSMSFGYRQPASEVTIEARSYQTMFLGVLNQVVGILGIFEPQDIYAMAMAVKKCGESMMGSDIERLDVVPQGFGSTEEFGAAATTCALEIAQNPELAIGVFDEILNGAGVGVVQRGEMLGRVRGSLDRIAPLAKKLAAVLSVGSAVVHAWDGIFDNVAEGLLTLSLSGSDTANPATLGPLSLAELERILTQQIRADGFGPGATSCTHVPPIGVEEHACVWESEDGSQLLVSVLIQPDGSVVHGFPGGM